MLHTCTTSSQHKLGVILYVQLYVCILSFALKAQSVIQSFDYEKHKILSWYNSNWLTGLLQQDKQPNPI